MPDSSRFFGKIIMFWVPVMLAGGHADAAPVKVENGGFEQVDPNGMPTRWRNPGSFGPIEITTEAPHAGARAGRIRGDGKQKACRQAIQSPPTRIYSASGWFRARGVSIEGASDDFARFYFHILYKDRPYAETTHVFVDLPAGDYDWRRFVVRLVPKTEYPVAEIWVTVAAKLSKGTLDFDSIELSEASPRGGWVAMEWRRFDKAIVLKDMGKAEPSEALSPRAKHGRWKVFSYEAGGYSGRMVWASKETRAPELKIPLGVQGSHAIYLGLADPSYLGCRALVRLSRDTAFVPRLRKGARVEEVFFKAADLTGQSLHLAQHCDSECEPCGLAYVKLVPLTDEEVAKLEAERSDARHRRLVATIDGFSYIFERRPVSRMALLEEVEVYRDTDFGTLILQMGGADMVNYPSKVGEMIGQDLDDFPRPGDRRYAEALRELARKGINPTRTLIEGAHDVGMKVHVSIRPGAWQYTEPMSDFFKSRFYLEHPEWRCVDRDGTLVPRMSLAVPEVRAHLVDVLREAVGFGADGANVLFIRGVPFVLFEEPFRQLFKNRHGCDPRELKEDDPRIQTMRCEIVTAFMRDIRRMLDEEGARVGGRRLALSAFVLGNEADNVRFGIEVRRWAKEGLIDLVCPHTGAGGARTREYDLKFFHEVCTPHKVRVAPSFVTWRLPSLEEVVRKSAEYYEAGADGIAFWDANAAAPEAVKWSIISRLGHVEEVKERAFEQAPKPVTSRFHKIGGIVVDRPYNPNWGY